MKITIHRESFLDAFGSVAPAIPTRSPAVAIQSALLVVTEDGATLTATNLELAISVAVPGVEVAAPGRVLLSPRFHQILRSSSDKALVVETTDAQVKVRGAGSTHTMPLEDPGKFPEVKGFAASDHWIVPAAELKRGIRTTTIAATENSTNYALGGIKFAFTDGTLRLVGFDGNRLALHEIEATEAGAPAFDPEHPPVVPAKALKLLERLLDEGSPPVDFAVDGRNSACFRVEGATVWTRLAEGRFPGHDVQAARQEWPSRARVGVGVLKEAVASAAVMTSEESRGVRFRFDRGSLQLESQTADIGLSVIDVELPWVGGPREVIIQDRYALTSLAALNPDSEVEVCLMESDMAILLESDRSRFFLSTLSTKQPQPTPGAN